MPCLPFSFSDEQFDQTGEKKFRVGGKQDLSQGQDSSPDSALPIT